jgi:hypothetical protein
MKAYGLITLFTPIKSRWTIPLKLSFCYVQIETTFYPVKSRWTILKTFIL